MANKPGMLRYLQSNLAELPLLLDEADAMRATRPAVGTKRPSGDEKKEKKLAEQQQKKAKKLEHKQLKVRMKVVRFLTKRPRDLEALRADPSATTAAKIFHGKPKLKDYLTTHADAIAQFVDEAVLLRGDEDPTSSSSSAVAAESSPSGAVPIFLALLADVATLPAFAVLALTVYRLQPRWRRHR